jgi:predicted enzyme related to lactoylglutathione lyase
MITQFAFTVYPVLNMARARKFYEGVLGLQVSHEYGGQWIEYHLNNNCFAITDMGGEHFKPNAAGGGSIAFEVDDLDKVVAQAKAGGAGVKIDTFQTPMCRSAILIDPEGNPFTLHKRIPVDENAGTVPHTDYAAAADIGRKTGGEVFDD